MSNYLKYFKAEFEKYAQEYAAPPKRHHSAGPAGSPTTPSGRGDVPTRKHVEPSQNVMVNPAPTVKQMQQSLIDLSKAVTSQINYQDVTDTNRPAQQGEAAGRDSFNNFLTHHFMRKSDVPATEFDPGALNTSVDKKSPTQPNRMLSMMTTISRIGNPGQKGGESVPDGRWGPRTNAALRDVYAFAYSMLQMASTMGSPPKEFSNAELSVFQKLIPSDQEVTPMLPMDQENMQRAVSLTQILKRIQTMYSEVKQDVLEGPYQSYIEGDTPFATYKKTGPDFNQQEKQMFDQLAGGNKQFDKTFSVFIQAPGQDTVERAAPPPGAYYGDQASPPTTRQSALMEDFMIKYSQQTAQQPGPSYTYVNKGTGANISISLSDLVSTDAFSKWYYGPSGNAIRGVPLPQLFEAIKKSIQDSGKVA